MVDAGESLLLYMYIFFPPEYDGKKSKKNYCETCWSEFLFQEFLTEKEFYWGGVGGSVVYVLLFPLDCVCVSSLSLSLSLLHQLRVSSA